VVDIELLSTIKLVLHYILQQQQITSITDSEYGVWSIVQIQSWCRTFAVEPIGRSDAFALETHITVTHYDHALSLTEATCLA